MLGAADRHLAPGRTSWGGAGEAIDVRLLVVVAGVPGAGKTTALRHVEAACPDPAPRVMDTDSVRCWARARLPRVPYPVLRPLVHCVHWIRIGVLAAIEPRPLAIHETATRPVSRAALLGIARLTRRRARLVWIDVDAETARRGQHDRNRVIGARSFRRHVARVGARDPMRAVAGTWDMVWRTDRDGAVHALLTALQTPTGPDPGGPARRA